MKEDSKTVKATPVGRRFMNFMAVFNAGRRDLLYNFILDSYIEAALEEYSAEVFADWHWGIYQQSGGFNVHKVFLSEDYYIIVIVESKHDGQLFFHKMKVEDQAPYKIIEYLHDPLDEAFSNR